MAIFSLSTAVFTQKLVDIILPSGKTETLIAGSILFGLILLIKAGLGYMRSLFLVTQSKDFNNRMIDSFFRSLLNQPKPFFDSKKIGEMIARMNDTRKIQVTVSNLVGNIFIEGIVVVFSLVGIFIYLWKIGLLVLSFVPIYVLVIRKLNNPVVSAQKDVMNSYAANESNYIDVISGISEIKGTSTAGLFHSATNTIYNLFQKSVFNLGRLQAKFNVRTELVGSILLLIVICSSSLFFIKGQLTTGGMIAILYLSGSIGPSITRLALFGIQLQEAKVAFQRMLEFTRLEEESLEGEVLLKINSIEVKELNFNFPGSLPLLKDINFKLGRGQIVTILGESGVGKSTILQLIQRFYTPSAGQILVDHKNINSFQLESYRKHVGIVPQEIKIFNNYLMFNIALTNDPGELDHVSKWCCENGFDTFFSRFPQGYMTLLGEAGINISGGQKQLVGFARALYRNPGVLCVDEGTSAMDSKTEDFILAELKKIKRKIPVLLITHRKKVASQSDYIYVLEKSRIIDEGTPEELFSRICVE